MSIRGIDVSSYQDDIQVQTFNSVEFVIAKATEGNSYVNPYCDTVIQRCINSGKLWGFYHYLSMYGNSGTEQADYFINNCWNYFQEGIPCVDWEGSGSPSSYYGSQQVNEFVRRVHDKTGVWPWIYSWPSWFNNGGVECNCGRWICSYPNVINPSIDYNPGNVPDTDGVVCCWQFASDGRIPEYGNDLDINMFLGDETAWHLYAIGDNLLTNEGLGNNKVLETTIFENEKYKVEISKKK